jgi:glycosyltransferase involved in cell wall biosynthesis
MFGQNCPPSPRTALPYQFFMRVSIAATNPCHVWALALELQELGVLGSYYSGYPAWKLGNLRKLGGMRLRTHSLRTLVTYVLHAKVPESFRPSNQALFRWQDNGFDRWVAKVLEPSDFHHGVPGQCLVAFRRAREIGVRTVLNHATGPASQVSRILQPEYDRIGMTVVSDGGFPLEYLERVREEISLSDFHCCASRLVRDQLVAEGVAAEKIWVVPYGADPRHWNQGPVPRVRSADEPFRILFAGQVSLRKGLRFLLAALDQAGNQPWRLDVYGPLLDESTADRVAYRGQVPVHYHGPVSQGRLAKAMRESDLLVLPSLEEGFGLVVVQALACGLPCAVSSMVGAKDLIEDEVNGSVFPVGDSNALLECLQRWAAAPLRVEGTWDWSAPAVRLIEESRRVMREEG